MSSIYFAAQFAAFIADALFLESEYLLFQNRCILIKSFKKILEPKLYTEKKT